MSTFLKPLNGVQVINAVAEVDGGGTASSAIMSVYKEIDSIIDRNNMMMNIMEFICEVSDEPFGQDCVLYEVLSAMPSNILKDTVIGMFIDRGFNEIFFEMIEDEIADETGDILYARTAAMANHVARFL